MLAWLSRIGQWLHIISNANIGCFIGSSRSLINLLQHLVGHVITQHNGLKGRERQIDGLGQCLVGRKHQPLVAGHLDGLAIMHVDHLPCLNLYKLKCSQILDGHVLPLNERLRNGGEEFFQEQLAHALCGACGLGHESHQLGKCDFVVHR